MIRYCLPVLVMLTGVMSSTEYYVILLIVLAWLFAKSRWFVPRISKIVVPLMILFMTGFISVKLSDYYAVFKDLWYISKLLIVTLVGAFIGGSFGLQSNWLKKLAIVVVFLSAVNIYGAMSGYSSASARSVSYAAVLLTPFLWRYYPIRGAFGHITRILLVSPSVVMLIVSGSRVAVLTLVISTLAVYKVLHDKSRTVATAFVLVTVALFLWPLLPQYDLSDITFLGKVQNAFNEVMFETGEDRLQMYANWRGFEAYRAFETWMSASFPEQVFGSGYGAEIDLGQVLYYQDDGYVTSLPFVHNAYFTLLVKTGVVGVLALAVALVSTLRVAPVRGSRDAEVLSQLVRASALTLLLTTAVIAGPLNKESLDGVLLIWGWGTAALLRLNLISAKAHQSHALVTSGAPGVQVAK